MRYADEWDRWCKESLNLFLRESRKKRCVRSSDSSLDHIIPVSQGGGHEKQNLQILTAKVNAMKGTLSNEEFVAICRRVAAWNS